MQTLSSIDPFSSINRSTWMSRKRTRLDQRKDFIEAVLRKMAFVSCMMSTWRKNIGEIRRNKNSEEKVWLTTERNERMSLRQFSRFLSLLISIAEVWFIAWRATSDRNISRFLNHPWFEWHQNYDHLCVSYQRNVHIIWPSLSRKRSWQRSALRLLAAPQRWSMLWINHLRRSWLQLVCPNFLMLLWNQIRAQEDPSVSLIPCLPAAKPMRIFIWKLSRLLSGSSVWSSFWWPSDG